MWNFQTLLSHAFAVAYALKRLKGLENGAYSDEKKMSRKWRKRRGKDGREDTNGAKDDTQNRREQVRKREAEIEAMKNAVERNAVNRTTPGTRSTCPRSAKHCSARQARHRESAAAFHLAVCLQKALHHAAAKLAEQCSALRGPFLHFFAPLLHLRTSRPLQINHLRSGIAPAFARGFCRQKTIQIRAATTTKRRDS